MAQWKRDFIRRGLRIAVLLAAGSTVAASGAWAEAGASGGEYGTSGKSQDHTGYRRGGNVTDKPTLRQKPKGVEGVLQRVAGDHRRMWIAGKEYLADDRTSVYDPNGLRKSLKDVVAGQRVVIQVTTDKAGRLVAKAVHIIDEHPELPRQI
ncbi:MAG: hypothetical protein KC466_07175 [Myxococcales bacterium]|nr:hypothetical protein [Myxococcales bacterium]